jgi:hypothetical protein
MADSSSATRAERLRHWLSDSPRGLLGVLADLIGVCTAIFVTASLVMAKGVVPAILASCLAAISVVSLLIIWRLESALRRRDQAERIQERVGSATPSVAAAIGDLSRGHLALSAERAGAAESFVQHCEAACKDFATAMHSLTGRACRVTLQEVYVPEEGPDDRYSVKTVAGSYGPRPPTDRQGVDLVEDNTDFDALMKGAEMYLCNDLVEEISAGYRNSHWTPEKLAEWLRTGGYPYRATVVWPLREMVEAGGTARWDLAGFLSVDSGEVGTFDRDTVQPLGEALAHAAYSGFVLYRRMKREVS